jgi:hypothetical protein
MFCNRPDFFGGKLRGFFLAKVNSLDFTRPFPHRFGMEIPSNPVTLTAAQIDELNKQLSKMRHDINNHLSLVIFAVEVLRTKPEMLERMSGTIADQPGKIMSDIAKFSAAFEGTLGVVRNGNPP